MALMPDITELLMKGLKIIVVLCAIILLQSKTWATHSTGLDLTYTCIGGDTFVIQLAFYRDCEGITAPGFGGRDLPTIDIFSTSCGLNFTPRTEYN